MKQKSNSSVKMKMWEYFCLFAVILLVAIWLVQIVFLQYFYARDMANESLNNARDIVQMYRVNELDEYTVRSLAYKNNMSIIIMDADDKIISASSAMGEMNPETVDRLSNKYVKSIEDLRQKIDEDKTSDSYMHIENADNNRKEFFYAAYTDKGVENGGTYIYIISQIEPIDAVTSVLKRQFVYSTVISLGIALIFAYLIAKRFSTPVEKITNSAKELALGNSEVDFKVEGAFGEIDQLSKALEYASGEINQAAELRRELMANVSHDLRTPLTMIKMYGEMMQDFGEDATKRDKCSKVIIDEADRLSLLVNDILDLSRLEKNKELDVKTFDLCAVVKTISERFAVMEEYNIELDIPRTLAVCADFSKIQQVLYNLISNAINYTGEDKTVKIRVTKCGTEALVEIIDSGEGISEEDLPLIWDRYYRSKTHVRSKVGTGLGLSIVKSILKMHEVDFGIKSEIGKGSDFWFYLKIAENERIEQIN